MRIAILVIALASTLGLDAVAPAFVSRPAADAASLSIRPMKNSAGALVVLQVRRVIGHAHASPGAASAPGSSDSAFVAYVYGRTKLVMPTDLRSLVTLVSGFPRAPRNSLQPGDLLLFENSSWTNIERVGIYIGSGLFAHAAGPQHKIIISRLENDPRDKNYWATHLLWAERLPVGIPASGKGTTVTGISAHVDVRRAPSSRALVMAVFMRGVQLRVVGHSHEWLKVQLSNAQLGWVAKSQVS